MTNWDAVVKQARESHTKQAWESLFEAHGEAMATSGNSKPIQEVYRTLRADPQALQYDPKIFGRLIQGCLVSWNLELGREIAEYAKRIPSPAVTIPSAQLYLESGQPAVAREVANRALRLTGVQPAERLQLEMLVASSYAEEGKRQKSVRLLTQIRASVESSELDRKERADLLSNMARMQTFLGRYAQAADLFYAASKLYRELGAWEAATKSIFNTAACHLNGGTKRRDEAFMMIEECRRLAEAHELPGPLAHCEAVYGHEAFWHGDFAAAREHLRRALEHLPSSDKSFRRLHIISMLALNYLMMGRYHLARKFGQQTLDLAALDESERSKSRYTNLRAELLWEDGLIEESQALLKGATAQIESRGVHTLEELAALSRYNYQSSILDGRLTTNKLVMEESLKKNHFVWLDWVNSRGHLLLNHDDSEGARRHFDEGLTRARQVGDRYHEAIGLLGLIQTMLRQRRADSIDGIFREFEVVVGRLGETPLKSQVLFIHAARAYQLGDFPECERILRMALKSPRQSFTDRFILQGWVATIEGRSSRLTADWQVQMVARYTRTYFAPTIEATDERHFRVSDHYTVSLERHPSLAELLHYLLLKSGFAADAAEIQTQVWKQSLATQGWQQKIRNTIMRLRDFFPYTIAPIIVHSDKVSLFKEAIAIVPSRREGIGTDEEIMRLLSHSPMSSLELAKRLKISAATAKRILKRLTDERTVHATKQGRNVFYQAQDGQSV